MIRIFVTINNNLVQEGCELIVQSSLLLIFYLHVLYLESHTIESPHIVQYCPVMISSTYSPNPCRKKTTTDSDRLNQTFHHPLHFELARELHFNENLQSNLCTNNKIFYQNIKSSHPPPLHARITHTNSASCHFLQATQTTALAEGQEG